MDNIIKGTLGLLLVILIASAGILSYQMFVDRAYRESLSSTYSYTCTITTDSPLANVTLFIPVPADPAGNSPVVAGFSARAVTGIPGDWGATLFDTGKATLVKITTPAITPPPGTGPSKPFTITMSADLKSGTVIDTRDPVNDSALFRPVGEITRIPCPAGSVPAGNPVCYRYVTSLYADYEAAAATSVNISATVSGRNSWKIFEPASNEYDAAVTVRMNGAHHGWSTMNGTLSEGIGTYTTRPVTA
jgi:hypothetical protein